MLPNDKKLVVRNRLFKFEPELLSANWNDNDPAFSQVYSVASVMAELSEQFLIARIVELIPNVNDPHLRTELKLFVAQESTHCHMHVAYNNTLRKVGFKIDILYKFYSLFLKTLHKVLPRNTLLGAQVSGEYLCALTAERLYQNRLGKMALNSESDVAKFWRWHLAEEAEHREVLHRLFVYCGGGATTLFFTTLGLMVSFLTFFNIGIVWLVLTGPAPKKGILSAMFRYNFGRDGMVWWLSRMFVKGVKEKFDPSLRCTTIQYEASLR